MTEDFLHHTWKYKLFDQNDLRTTSGEPIIIMRQGDHNFHSGPDFFNARLKIGETLWAGNVEVHINASDWNRHRHQEDIAYDNIILHVVWNADHIPVRRNGEPIPTLEIHERIDPKLYEKYQGFRNSSNEIPCEKQISGVPALVVNSMLDRLLPERLERKTGSILQLLALNNSNWEETFYQALAKNFGFHVNSAPFELLAKSLPSSILARHRSSQLQLEALLFGQAGMLEDHFTEKFPRALQNEFVFLKRKYSLFPLDAHLWKYLRLRPVNFPEVRIAQFAALVCNSSKLFSKMLEMQDLKGIRQLLDVNVSPYWDTHYTFGKSAKLRSKRLGADAINNIIINTIAPFLFVYGRQKAEEHYAERALGFLSELPGESNSIISKWRSLRLPVHSAAHTQALLQLRNEYCATKSCLKCRIGDHLLKN